MTLFNECGKIALLILLQMCWRCASCIWPTFYSTCKNNALCKDLENLHFLFGYNNNCVSSTSAIVGNLSGHHRYHSEVMQLIPLVACSHVSSSVRVYLRLFGVRYLHGVLAQ